MLQLPPTSLNEFTQYHNGTSWSDIPYNTTNYITLACALLGFSHNLIQVICLLAIKSLWTYFNRLVTI